MPIKGVVLILVLAVVIAACKKDDIANLFVARENDEEETIFKFDDEE